MKVLLCTLAALFLLILATPFGLYALSAKKQKEAVANAKSKSEISEVIDKYGEPGLSYTFTEELPPPENFAESYNIQIGINENAYCFFLKGCFPCRAFFVVTDSSGKILRVTPYQP
jgi:hypothetical protein